MDLDACGHAAWNIKYEWSMKDEAKHPRSSMNGASKIKHDSSMNHQVWIKYESSIKHQSWMRDQRAQTWSIKNAPSRMHHDTHHDASCKTAARSRPPLPPGMHAFTWHVMHQLRLLKMTCHKWLYLKWDDMSYMGLDQMRWHVINGIRSDECIASYPDCSLVLSHTCNTHATHMQHTCHASHMPVHHWHLSWRWLVMNAFTLDECTWVQYVNI